MSSLAPPAVVLIAIIAAAAVVAMGAAMHRLYSSRGVARDPEAMTVSFSNEQSHYMRDVRLRGQLQAYGVAPGFEDDYQPPRSQVGRPHSRGGDTSSYV